MFELLDGHQDKVIIRLAAGQFTDFVWLSRL